MNCQVFISPTVVGIVLSVVFAAGCSTVPGAQQPAEVVEAKPLHPLVWVEIAEVNKDIQRAAAKSDYRLLAFSGRRVTIPGVESTEKDSAQRLCGVDYLRGGGAVDTDADRILLNKAFDYAFEYNREMLKHCKSAKN